MSVARISRAALDILTGSLIALGLEASTAFAQTQAPPTPPSIPPVTGGAAASGGGHAMALLGVIVALLVIIALLAKWSALRGRRETEAVQLEAQIADALLRERALVNLGVLPRAHVPLLRGSPATVEVTGQVPSPELREEVLRVAEREAKRIRPDAQLFDRIRVTAPAEARAA